MALYVAILEGPTPSRAEPVLSSGDPRLIAAVARELGRVLGMDHVPARVLALGRNSDTPPASS